MIDSLIKDIDLMEKYYCGRDIDLEDRSHIDRLCSIGFMNRGISLKRKVVTARLTYLGLKIVKGFRGEL